MKKILVLLLILTTTVAFAKKVKFAVDLTGFTPNPLGVHIAGDFQVIAGFGTVDWSTNTTPLTQEGNSNIYSIVVNLPAFAKYEFKFINGDQWYDSEFVPEASRVGYQLNDSRWIYVDSIGNDTTLFGPILFGGNASVGKYLLRFKVDMQNLTVNTTGVHVAGNFTVQNWLTTQNRMYSFDGNVYEIITYVDSANYQYKFYNGNSSTNAEIVPINCAVNGNRQIKVKNDTVIDIICFADCIACSNGIKNRTNENSLNIYPNPSTDFMSINCNNALIDNVLLFDVTGRLLKKYENINKPIFIFEKANLSFGLYIVKIQVDKKVFTQQIIFN